MQRTWVQLLSTILSNPWMANFMTGRLYRGEFKKVCIPGLNCYSCPAAVAACPLGALQTILADPLYTVSFYALGWLILFGMTMGRWICGWLCPFGMIQDGLHRIPLRNRRLPSWMKYIKYVVLVVFAVYIPMMLTDPVGLGEPAFCKYLCPAGTLEAGIPLLLTHEELQAGLGWLFALKLSILIIIILVAGSIYRPFCRVLCPLGAFYGCFHAVSLYRYQLDGEACTACSQCSQICPMDIDPRKVPNSPECIRCGLCLSGCPQGCITDILAFKDKPRVDSA